MRCIISDSLLSDKTVTEYIKMPTNALVRDPIDKIYFVKFARNDNFNQLLKSARQILESDAKADVKDKYKWLISYIEQEKHIKL